MDLASIVRTLGGLATVLGIMSAALWMVRRYDIRLPGRTGMLRLGRLELVERLPLDSRRSVALLRRDGREHLILIAPEGHLILESAVVRDAADVAAETAIAQASAREVPQFRAELAAAGQSFGTLVEHARKRTLPLGGELKRLIGRVIAAIAAIAAARAVARARARDVPIQPPSALRATALRILRDTHEYGIRLGRTAAAASARLRRVARARLKAFETLFDAIRRFTRRAASFDTPKLDIRRTLAQRSKRVSLLARRTFVHVEAAARAGLAILRHAGRLLAREQRQVSARVEATLRRIVGPTAAVAAPAPPIFHDPPIALRTNRHRKPSRKAARKARAARRGRRHA